MTDLLNRALLRRASLWGCLGRPPRLAGLCKWTLVASIAFGCAAAVTGCKACTGNNGESTSQATAAGSSPEPTAREHAQLELLVTGAEPRRVLQYTQASDQREITLHYGMHGEDDSEQQPMIFKLRWKPEGGSPMRWSYDVHEARLGGKIEDPMADIHDAMGKLYEQEAGHLTLHDSGDIEVASVSPMHSAPSIAGLLDGFAVPWPDSPIGVGARWTMTRPAELGAFRGPQPKVSEALLRRTYEIETMEADRVVVVMQVEQDFSYELRFPNGEKRTGRENTSLQGKVTIELDDPLARSGELSGVSAHSTSFERGQDDGAGETGAVMTIENQVKLVIRLSTP